MRGPAASRASAHASATRNTAASPSTRWLQAHRLTNPARIDRRGFALPLAEVARHIGRDEVEVAAALFAGGYGIDEGGVNMQRIYWRMAVGPKPRPASAAQLRGHIDALAGAWDRQMVVGSVGTALQLGGEMKRTIAAALAPEPPTAAGLAKLLRRASSGQAEGDRFVFALVALKPRQYAVRLKPGAISHTTPQRIINPSLLPMAEEDARGFVGTEKGSAP